MVPSLDTLRIVNAVIDSVPSHDLSDEDLIRLSHIFPEQLVIAALDLIDRRSVLKYTTEWGHTEYQVIGSNGTYLVFLDMVITTYPYVCDCPGFIYHVIQQKHGIVCKHILATLLANRMSLCVEREMQVEDLAALYMRQFSIAEEQESVPPEPLPGD